MDDMSWRKSTIKPKQTLLAKQATENDFASMSEKERQEIKPLLLPIWQKIVGKKNKWVKGEERGESGRGREEQTATAPCDIQKPSTPHL